MKFFLLLCLLFLSVMGVQAQTVRDINTKDATKFKIKLRPSSIDPKPGTVRNPNEYLEDIELDTLIKIIANYLGVSANALEAKLNKSGGIISNKLGIGTNTTPYERLEVNGNIGFTGGAKIVISPNGKSISIRPAPSNSVTSPTTNIPIVLPRIELYEPAAAVAEDSMKRYDWKGFQAYKQTFYPTGLTNTTAPFDLLSNIRELFEIGGYCTYTNLQGIVISDYINSYHILGSEIVKFDDVAKKLKLNPANCGTCTNLKCLVRIKYTKQ